MELQIPFGIRNDKIIHISELGTEERGLKCLCQCPYCGQMLEARMGNVRIHYFAHSSKECSNDVALQTALHMFAKEVLSERKKIMLPESNLFYVRECIQLKDFEDLPETKYEPCEKLIRVSKLLEFDLVQLEKRIDDIIPDVVIYKDNQPLIIEIAVTHFIDDEKSDKIRQKGISALEIDLSDIEMDHNNFDRNKVANIIIESVDYKVWIYNRREEDVKEEIIKDNIVFLQEQELIRQRKLNQLEKDFQRRQKEHEQQMKKLEVKTTRITNALKPENYKRTLEGWDSELDNNHMWIEVSKTLKISKQDIPVYFNIPVSGEIAFNCDRRLWQSLIFEVFIHNRVGKTLAVSKIVSWAEKYSGLDLNNDFVYTKDIIKEKIPDLAYAVKEYIKFCIKCGFLDNQNGHINFWSSFYIIDDNYRKPIDVSDIDNDPTRMEKVSVISNNEKQSINQVDTRIEDKWAICELNIIDDNYRNSIDVSDIDNDPIRMEKVSVISNNGKQSINQVDTMIENKWAICELCGEYTNKWRSYYGKTNTCKCYKCCEKEKSK